MALHPEGMEVVLAPGADGEERLSPAVGNAVLAPTSISYHLANRGGDPRLLVVVGTRKDAGTGEREPEQHGVVVEGDTAGGTSGGGAQGAAEAATEEKPGAALPEATGQDPSGLEERQGGELDVEAHVGAALARILAAAGDPPPAAGGLEGEERGQEGVQRAEGIGGEEDDGV